MIKMNRKSEFDKIIYLERQNAVIKKQILEAKKMTTEARRHAEVLAESNFHLDNYLRNVKNEIRKIRKENEQLIHKKRLCSIVR